MKNIVNWRLQLIIIFVALSALTYFIHYLIFHDVHHIFLYMIGDMGFLFLDVLLVVLVIEHLLNRREKRLLLNKLNMVIGTFFSEVGLELMRRFFRFLPEAKELAEDLDIKLNWKPKDFQRAAARAEKFSYAAHVDADSLAELREFLRSKRDFLLRLLENPNLIEHDRFTDLLWAVFHLTEELDLRQDLISNLPQTDYEHLANDLTRAYSMLAREWVYYTSHLQRSYPFLFSLAARINPFNPNPSPIVQ